jgi:hypothetical protein
LKCKIIAKEEKILSNLFTILANAAIIAEKKDISFATADLIRMVRTMINNIGLKGFRGRSRSESHSKNGHRSKNRSLNRSVSESSEGERSRMKKKKEKKEKDKER